MPSTTEIIRRFQEARQSRVLCLLTTDRIGVSPLMSMMQQDALRHVYDLARAIWSDNSKKFDLFLYTRGGDSDVPWALMSMLREIIGKEKELTL